MGANVAQQCLAAGLVHELEIHLVPVLLGAGRRLFEGLGAGRIELERIRVVESPDVTHLRFRVATERPRNPSAWRREGYGAITAVGGLGLDLPEGTCVGLLSPNGARKSSDDGSDGTRTRERHLIEIRS